MLILAIVVILVVILPGVLQAGSLEDLEFEYLTIKDGLSQSGVIDVIQDSKGFMWFGTQSGLSRYDGVNFKIYKNVAGDPQTLSMDFITSLYEDNRGYIWVGTNGGGLNRLDPKTGRVTRYDCDLNNSDGLTHKQISAITQDRNGNMWIGTIFGLNRLNPATGKIKRFLSPPWGSAKLPHHNILSLSTAPDGTIWIGSEGGLTHLEPGTERFVNYKRGKGGDNGLRGHFASAVYVDSGGTVWLGSEGLSKLDPDSGEFVHYDTGSVITSVYRDRTGLVWVGTALNGAFVLDPGKQGESGLTRFRYNPGPANGLSWDSILRVYEDRSGIIWFGTAGGGICKLDRNKRKFKLWNRPAGSRNHQLMYSMHGVYEDHRGIVWMATEYGGLIRLERRSGKMTHLPLRQAENENRKSYIRPIAGDPDGKLWLGSTRIGIIEFDPSSGNWRSHLPMPGNVHANRVLALIRGRDGMMWAGCKFGLFFRFDTKNHTFTRYIHDPIKKHALRPYTVRALHEDQAGNIWLGTSSRGMLKFNRREESFTRYVAPGESRNGLNDNDILAIHEDASGYIWVGTSGGGLNRFDPRTGLFRHYTTRDGLPNDVIYGILEDDKHNLWLSTNKGISRFDPVKGTFKNFGHRDGLQGYEFNSLAYFKNKSGEMFFGGINGLNMFFPARFVSNAHQPPVVITGFSLFHRPVELGEHSPLSGPLTRLITYTSDITLSYKNNTLSFEFAALDYTAPRQNQYKYKVDGLHDDWNYLGNRNHVSLAGLVPGTYVLHVNGSNNDGVWNDTGTSLTIRITPPFWQTWWFRVLVILIAIALTLLWHRHSMERAMLQLKTESQMNKIFAKYSLSEREQEVLALVLKGKTNNQIEDELFISLATVKKHIYSVYRKMGVNNRLELINTIQRTLPGNKTSGLSST